MGHRAFLIAGDCAAPIANDICDFHYRAASHCIPVGAQAPARCCDRAETQFMVEDGMVEFMVGGATGMVPAGDFVRVPAGIIYAYRNAGETHAHLLVRTVSPTAAAQAMRITSGFAA